MIMFLAKAIVWICGFFLLGSAVMGQIKKWLGRELQSYRTISFLTVLAAILLIIPAWL